MSKKADAVDKKLKDDVTELHKFVKSNLKKFNQEPLRHSIRKILETHALLDMQRDVRNAQSMSGYTSGSRRKSHDK